MKSPFFHHVTVFESFFTADVSLCCQCARELRVHLKYIGFHCLFTDVYNSAIKARRPATSHPTHHLSLSVSLKHTHTYKIALFLSANHIDPIHSHQLARRRATACDSRSPRQPTYVHARKRRLALQSCLCVGSICPSAEQSRVPDNEI